MDSTATLLTQIEHHANTQGEKTALEWWQGDQPPSVETLSYTDLYHQSTLIASSIQEMGMTGERILLPHPPGLEFVVAWIACMLAGAVPVPVPFPRNRRTSSRTIAIMRDATPRLCIAPSLVIERVQHSLRGEEHPPHGAPPVFVAQETLLVSHAGQGTTVFTPITPPPALAYLQYTSGTGGIAKGSMVTHDNLRHNIAALESNSGASTEATFVSWLPQYHDMQLVAVLGLSLWLGTTARLFSPVEFIQRPARWLNMLSGLPYAISGGPNFAYEHCLQRVRKHELDAIDLSGWRVAFNSSERIRPQTLERFQALTAAQGFKPAHWFPAYGLAESTAFATGLQRTTPPRVRRSPADNTSMVSCGRAAPGHHVCIVDPATKQALGPDLEGEIHLAGGSVTAGYWNRPDENTSLFVHLAKTPEGYPKGPYLKTGDLGFVDESGELFVTGRIKDLIIINGINHHPQDLEAAIDDCHPALRPGEIGAFSLPNHDGKREELAVVAELTRSHRRNPVVPEITQAIQRILSRDFDLVLDHLLLLRPGEMPKTTSGKIQRSLCRLHYEAHAFDHEFVWHRVARASIPPPHHRIS